MRHPLAFFVSIALVLLVLSPIGWILFRAIEAYGELFGSLVVPRLVVSAAKSLLLAAGVAFASTLLSIPIAWLTHATDMPGRKLFRRLLVLPLAIPSYISGFVVVATFGPSGITRLLGLPDIPIYGYFGTWAALMFVYPYVLLPLQSALLGVDPHRWEAARSLGASSLRAFYDVIWPEMRLPAIRGASIVALYVLSDFGAVSLMRYPSLSFLIYQRYSSPFRRYEAVAYALVLVVLAILLLLCFMALRGKSKNKRQSSIYANWPDVSLGGWRWPATLFCSFIVFLGAVGPLAVVAWWLIRGLMNHQTIFNLTEELINSFHVAIIGALVITLLGVPPAILQRFTEGKLSRWIDRGLHLGYAIPGVVVGLAFVYIGSQYLPFIYQTLWLLQLAYIVRFIPQASSSLGDSFVAQDTHLYEASRSLGKTHIQTIRKILIPIALPTLAAAFIAVFISIIKELPTTLLLKPPGFSTLAYRIWSLTQEAFFTATAPTVFALILLALIALFIRKDSLEK